MTIISRIFRGCGYLPGYGSHPGTGALFLFIAMAAVAGLRAGWRGALLGACVMGAVFGPMYLYGAYDRARSFDRARKMRPSGKDKVAEALKR